jgi:YegS/Rv2252/BmrU family lipid kinase
MAELQLKVIVNPAAGAYSTRRKWPRISQWLNKVGLLFDHVFTEGVGHAIELAGSAVSDGYRRIVAVGGDGTVNEVVNGVLASGSSEVAIGVISTGTGGDFIRSIGIPRDYNTACSCLTGQRRVQIDIGVVEYQSQGQTVQRFFVNAAGVGFDASVVAATERFPKYLGGTVPYLAGLLGCLFSYQNKPVELRFEDVVESRRVLAVVVANGCYFGGGMHVAPLAKIDDGLLDVVTINDIGKFELLKELPRVYKGTHLSHPKISLSRTKRITVESPETVLVHADGELLGTCPASFWLVPVALNILV